MTVLGQSEQETFENADLESQWGVISNDWSYKVGDDIEWSNPEFDDASWEKQSSPYLKAPASKEDNNKKEIVWLRKKLKTNYKSNQQLVLRINQTGASEIYLDGKLIHRLGSVSTNPDSIVFYNPNKDLLSFPLVSNTEQLLAVRYVNAAAQFPLYSVNKEGIILRVATLNHSNHDDPPLKQFTYGYYVIFGVGLLMFILFLSYYFFFPSERVNLYFALSSLFFALFVIAVLKSVYTHNVFVFGDFLAGIFIAAHAILALYCIYKILNKKLGFVFKIILILGILYIPMLFVISYELISPILSILVLFDTIRVSFLSLKTNRKGALIFLIFGGLNIFFWIGIIANELSLLEIPNLWVYQPFALLFVPCSLALYLGYSFGINSQSLQNKLIEVEQLSEEKQQLLADQNIKLEKEVVARTADLMATLDNLKATQSQLIQSEKMASLGELTAGIAHEIQNPLNFVNNFSEVSNELLLEMNEAISKSNYDEVREIVTDVKTNLEKINYHGKRAEAIVQGMLQHSRVNPGLEEPTDINALCDEFLRLAYHGLRAKDKSFNASLITNFDESIKHIKVVPQDLGRVILNLMTNAFYAVNERSAEAKRKGYEYESTVSVSTKSIGDFVEIKVSDNGNGIPKRILEKIFQPFFTTKPSGKGTGLGLSLSYDIIKAHDGTLKVETIENDGASEKSGTIFIIHLPKR